MHAKILSIAIAVVVQSGSPAPDEPFTQTIPGCARGIEMVAVPGGVLRVAGEDGAVREVPIAPFFMLRHEVTWDLYDVLVHRLDLPPERRDVDAETRPTQPYVSADRGWGHAGFPALSISHHGAEAFAAWLRETTGRPYRLPTEHEHEWAARAGTTTRWSFGDDEERLKEHVWYRSNSSLTTHAAGSKPANAWGLFELVGNVAEWVVAEDGSHLLAGGCYSDRPRDCHPAARKVPIPAWNASDPQLPKSRWWLADAPFAGFRVVCDVEEQDGD